MILTAFAVINYAFYLSTTSAFAHGVKLSASHAITFMLVYFVFVVNSIAPPRYVATFVPTNLSPLYSATVIFVPVSTSVGTTLIFLPLFEIDVDVAVSFLFFHAAYNVVLSL